MSEFDAQIDLQFKVEVLDIEDIFEMENIQKKMDAVCLSKKKMSSYSQICGTNKYNSSE